MDSGATLTRGVVVSISYNHASSDMVQCQEVTGRVDCYHECFMQAACAQIKLWYHHYTLAEHIFALIVSSINMNLEILTTTRQGVILTLQKHHASFWDPQKKNRGSKTPGTFSLVSL